MSRNGLFAVVVFWSAVICLTSGSIPWPSALVGLLAIFLLGTMVTGLTVFIYKAFD